MAAGLDDDANYRFLAERLASFEAVQALDHCQLLTVPADLDRRRLTVLNYTLGKGLDRFRIVRLPPSDRKVDVPI